MITVLPPTKILGWLLCYFRINADMADMLFSQLLTHPMNVYSSSPSSGFTLHHLGCFSLWFWLLLCLSQRSHQTRLRTPTALSYWSYSFSLESVALEGECISIQEWLFAVTIHSVLPILHHSFSKLEVRKKTVKLWERRLFIKPGVALKTNKLSLVFHLWHLS